MIVHFGLCTATVIAGCAVRGRSAALVLQPHLRLTSLTQKSEDRCTLGGDCDSACRHRSRRERGVFKLV